MRTKELKLGLIALIATSCLIIAYATIPSFKEINFSVTVNLLPDDLIVLEAKPVQVVYNAEALVKDKISVIYVVVQSTFSEIKYADVELTYDFGLGKIVDSGPDGSGIPICPGINRIFVPGGPVVNETWHVIQNSWNAPFIRWTRTGIDNKIKVVLDPDNNVEESEESNNEYLAKPFKVVDTRGLSILFVPACFEGEQPPSASDVDGNASKSAYFLWATYPVAEIEANIGVRFAPYQRKKILPYEQEMNLMCFEIARMAKLSGYDRGVGMVPKDWFSDKGFNYRGMTPRTPTQGCLVEHVYWVTVSHEIGHTFGLRRDKEEFEIAPNVWGFESSGFWVWNRETIPRQNEKSAHCFMGSITSYEEQKYYIDHPTNRAGRWICDECYNKLLSNFKVCDPDVMLISGIIYKNNTVILDPIYILKHGTPDLSDPGEGNYKIVLLNDADEILSEYWFNVSFIDYFNPEVELEFTPFLFCVPFDENVRQIRVVNTAEQTLTNVFVSDNSPTISLQSPHAGERIRKGSIINVTWTAEDPDEDTLTFSLLYSGDYGETWIPIVTDTTQRNYTIDTKDLTPGNYLIKVLASDGFNTAEDVLDQPITVEGIHDITILNITFSKQNPSVNETLFTYVVIQNRGDFTETFNVFVNYTRILDPLIGIQTLTLFPGESVILNFTWTPSVSGRYEIIAYTSQILNDINPDNNSIKIIVYVYSKTLGSGGGGRIPLLM